MIFINHVNFPQKRSQNKLEVKKIYKTKNGWSNVKIYFFFCLTSQETVSVKISKLPPDWLDLTFVFIPA